MPSAVHVALAGLTLFAVAAYVVVTASLLRRPAPADGRAAIRGFALWWGGLAVLGLFNIAVDLGFDLAMLGLGGALVAFYAIIILLLAMVAGLVYFLLYVYSGRRSWLGAVLVFYGVLATVILVVTVANEPYIATENGARMLDFRHENTPAVGVSLLLALVGPAFAAAVAYFLLGFRVDDVTTKYRIFMTSGGLALWMGYSLLSSAARAVASIEERSITSQATAQALGLIAALLVLFAYYPPPALRRRYGLRTIAEETPHEARVQPVPRDGMVPVPSRAAGRRASA